MLNSSKIEDLHPKLQKLCKNHILACAKRRVKIIVTSTLRDQEYQSKLYAQGRTVAGPVVTNMQLLGPHGFGLAYDVVPVVDGKTVWNNERLWSIIGEEGRKLGLTWGGDWKTFVDKPHFQLTDGLSAAELRSGRRPKWWNESSIEVPIKKGSVAVNTLNVRKEPAMTGIVVSQLKKGAAVNILEVKDGWYRIGVDRWVNDAYIRIV